MRESKEEMQCHMMKSNASCNATRKVSDQNGTRQWLEASCKGMKKFVAAKASKHDAIARHQ